MKDLNIGMRIVVKEKGKDLEEEKKNQINPVVKKILKEKKINTEKIELVLNKLLEIEELDLGDCEVLPCLDKNPDDSHLGCWYLKIKDQAKDKGIIKIFCQPEFYFQMYLYFPEKFRQVSQKMYLLKGTKPEVILKLGINIFLRRVLGKKAPQL